jgi:hypothetical protein
MFVSDEIRDENTIRGNELNQNRHGPGQWSCRYLIEPSCIGAHKEFSKSQPQRKLLSTLGHADRKDGK